MSPTNWICRALQYFFKSVHCFKNTNWSHLFCKYWSGKFSGKDFNDSLFLNLNSPGHSYQGLPPFCSFKMVKSEKSANRQPVYWWNDEITNMRSECIHAEGNTHDHEVDRITICSSRFLRLKEKPLSWRSVEISETASLTYVTTLKIIRGAFRIS